MYYLGARNWVSQPLKYLFIVGQILAGITPLITLFLGCKWIFEYCRPSWKTGRQVIAALILTASIVIISVLANSDKFIIPKRGKEALSIFGKSVYVADKSDLISLREMADRAYRRQDYSAVVDLMTWAIEFDPTDESFYEMRARAYKRQNEFERNLKDQITVLRLNSGRQWNHLSVVEDYILLTQFDEARAWIRKNRDSLTDKDCKTMFNFFELFIDILEGRPHTDREREFRTQVLSNPLTAAFEKYWAWHYLEKFVLEKVSDKSKAEEAKNLIQLLEKPP